jgi:hypothetical protein
VATQAQSSSCFCCLLVKGASEAPKCLDEATSQERRCAQPAAGITARCKYRSTHVVPCLYVGVSGCLFLIPGRTKIRIPSWPCAATTWLSAMISILLDSGHSRRPCCFHYYGLAHSVFTLIKGLACRLSRYLRTGHLLAKNGDLHA